MAEDEEIPLMLLAPFRMWSDPHFAKGMRQLRAACGHLAWISPQGAAWIAGRPVRTTCTNCAPPDLDQCENYLVPGAREAAAKDLSPQEHQAWDRVLRRYNVNDLPPEADPQ